MYKEYAVRKLRNMFDNRDLRKLYSRYISWAKKHPVFSAIAGIIVAFYTVPIAIYVAFSVVAFIITFAGFLIILGAILLVGFLVLSAALATITVITVFMLLVAWFIYRTYDQLNQILDSTNTDDIPHSTTDP